MKNKLVIPFHKRMNSIENLKSSVRKFLFSLNKPYYYKYAEKNIPCECPLCPCPSGGRRKDRDYGFAYISEHKKIIYFSIPKSASGTIRKTLFPEGNRATLIHPKQSSDKYFKFTFVRNPWARMVSNWTMFTKYKGRIRQLKSMTDEDLSKFEDFIDFAKRAKNHHWQPQVLFIPEEPDFIGKVENFNEDFSKLCHQIGFSIEMPNKTGSSEHKPYWEYYTPSLVEQVREMYAEDIERFGYTFGE